MRGLLVDINIQGHAQILTFVLDTPDWKEFWTHLAMPMRTFKDVGLLPTDSDVIVWRLCQQQGLILLTANRNKDGPDSLEATIANENTPGSLPVMTIANAEQVRQSRTYAVAVVERMLQYLLDIENFRGTGRLCLP